MNILEQSIGQDPESFMKVLLVFQIVLVTMYIIVVTFIVLLTPKTIQDENADEQTVKDSQGLLETLVRPLLYLLVTYFIEINVIKY